MTLTELRAALEQEIDAHERNVEIADRMRQDARNAQGQVVDSRLKMNALRAQIIEMEKGESNG